MAGEEAEDVKGKKLLAALLAALAGLLLSGCMMTASVEELYSPPKLPTEYQALGARIDQILASGAEYASPTSGTNLQSVQLEDLNGDGSKEAVAFFRRSGDERPMKIYIFRAHGDSYEQAALIEGSGTAIHSVRYEDMNSDGVKELLVSWKVSAEVQAMAVYALEDLEPVLTMSTAYARYEVMDLDDDDIRELVVLRSDETEPGSSLADYYDWDGNSLLLRSTAKLSMSVAELKWVETGTLAGGEKAVFVTGRATGVDETSRAITDILVYRQPDLTNIVLSSSTGVSTEIVRFLNLQPTDIDNDGATEVPKPAELLSEAGGETYFKIYWYSYQADGLAIRKDITYHNLADSWYMVIPESWDGHFTVRQDSSSTTEHATTFYAVSGRKMEEELFTIYTLTGSSREAQATANGRSILRRQPNVIYAVRFADGYRDWRYCLKETEVAACFNAILTQWSTGEE